MTMMTTLTGLMMFILAAAPQSLASEPQSSRAVQLKSYKTQQGDTLQRLAHRFFRDKSWWPRLKKHNPRLRKVRRDQRLPAGVEIKYEPRPISQQCLAMADHKIPPFIEDHEVRQVPKGQPVHDPYLERRLKNLKTYTASEGDSLALIAHKLYGHTSWWSKFKKFNPKLSHYQPRQKIPEGKKIQYLAPQIGDAYIVHKNDTLARIAEWKYGLSNYWTKAYSLNTQTIDDPTLIFPGDCLVLEPDGTIKNPQSGTVLTQAPKRLKRRVASSAPTRCRGDWWCVVTTKYPVFLVALAVALLALLLLWSTIRYTFGDSDYYSYLMAGRQQAQNFTDEDYEQMRRQRRAHSYQTLLKLKKKYLKFLKRHKSTKN